MGEQNELLVKRLERLERANRRMKVIGVALVAAFVAMGAKTPVGSPPILRAGSFQVVDNHGHVLATLGASSGNGSLLLYDQTGALRDSAGTSADLIATGFSTFQGNGFQRTGEGIAEDTHAGFGDFDQTGSERAFIGDIIFQNQSGAAGYDPTGAAQSALIVDPINGFSGFVDDIRNTGTVTFNNRVILGTSGSVVTAPDTEGLFLVDANDVIRAGISADNPCCGAGNDLLFFNNASDLQVGNFFAPGGGGGSYNTFDKNGTATGSLP